MVRQIDPSKFLQKYKSFLNSQPHSHSNGRYREREKEEERLAEIVDNLGKKKYRVRGREDVFI